MTDSFFEVHYKPGEEVVLHFKTPDFKGLPEGTRQHMLAAKKEMLIAIRSMLDKAIDKTEEKAKTKPRGGRTKVDIQ